MIRVTVATNRSVSGSNILTRCSDVFFVRIVWRASLYNVAWSAAGAATGGKRSWSGHALEGVECECAAGAATQNSFGGPIGDAHFVAPVVLIRIVPPAVYMSSGLPILNM